MMILNDQAVYVAMSGGVDSAVTAARLLAEGYQVTGIHMTTWKDPEWAEESKSLPDPSLLAKETCDLLGIPFISLDVSELFYERVVQEFVRHYLEGKTPNPCLFCNPQVKWGVLQAYALEKGADCFATGHYARIEHLLSGKVRLLRGVDPTKDQSYVLSMLSQFQLSRSLLPLGEMTKDEVRKEAFRLGLPVADRQDSQDLCFLGNVDYRDFLQRIAPKSAEPGKIVNIKGEVLGEHQGLAFYTVGQRKGIRVAAHEPYYVVGKDIENNRLVVGYGDQAGNTHLTAIQANWIAGEAPEVGECYSVMVRYRADPVVAKLTVVTCSDFRLEFNRQLRGISPGQVAVLYSNEECLGGGVIQNAG